MGRVQPPCSRRWSWLPYDTRHDSRSRYRRGRHRYRLLWSNLSLFSGHPLPHLIYPCFKGLFPSEINQSTDNKYFDQ
jgi:hypothetical protein